MRYGLVQLVRSLSGTRPIPRFMADQAAWHEPRAHAQAMVTVDEHLASLGDPDWRCRHEVIDRLVARGKNDAARQVRDCIAMKLHEFPRTDVEAALREAEKD